MQSPTMTNITLCRRSVRDVRDVGINDPPFGIAEWAPILTTREPDDKLSEATGDQAAANAATSVVIIGKV
jgi:hypothetical protein